VKFFIGAKGANINEIKQKAEKDGGAVTVQVLPPTTPGGPQQVQVCGDNIALARQLVLEKLEQVKQQVIDFQLANGVEVPEELLPWVVEDGGACLRDIKRRATCDGGQLSIKVKRGSGPTAPTLVQLFGTSRETARRLVVERIKESARLKASGAQPPAPSHNMNPYDCYRAAFNAASWCASDWSDPCSWDDWGDWSDWSDPSWFQGLAAFARMSQMWGW